MSRFLIPVLVFATLLVPSLRNSAQAATNSPRQAATINRIIELANAERAAAGLPSLTPNALLMGEAQRFSVVQADLGRLSHRGTDGSNAGQRFTWAGYKWRFYGENLAAGQPTPERVVGAWMNSPPHRANILSTRATQIGVGHTERPNDPSRYVDYYVMELGQPR